jgi:hypothetical protein
MNIWLTKCRKQASCRHCPNPILNGEYMVVGEYYKSTRTEKGGKAVRWRRRLHWHPQCWIDQAIAALKNRGDATETRGRKKLALPEHKSTARIKILRRRAAVMQRLKIEVSKPTEEQSTDRIIHLGGLLNKLKEEIESFGGVPKSW